MNKINLYECFSKWNQFDGIYLYSDPHFRDLDCYRLRFPQKFETLSEDKEKELVEELDEMQVKNINNVCSKTSMLIILGDVGDISYISRLKAKYKVLILGNHDKGASNYKRDLGEVHLKRLISYYYEEVRDREDNHLFDEVYEGPVFINKKILLSHEPIYLPFAYNIHGHDHSNRFENEKTHDYHLNVCAENIDFTPMNLSAIIKSGVLNKIDDIHRCTIDKAIENKLENKEN